MKKYDIYFSNLMNRILYIKDIRADQVHFCEITLTECKFRSSNYDWYVTTFQTNVVFLENREVPEMEIMNLDKLYPELFI